MTFNQMQTGRVKVFVSGGFATTKSVGQQQLFVAFGGPSQLPKRCLNSQWLHYKTDLTRMTLCCPILAVHLLQLALALADMRAGGSQPASASAGP